MCLLNSFYFEIFPWCAQWNEITSVDHIRRSRDILYIYNGESQQTQVVKRVLSESSCDSEDDNNRVYEGSPRSIRSNIENTRNLGKIIYISQHDPHLTWYHFPSNVQ